MNCGIGLAFRSAVLTIGLACFWSTADAATPAERELTLVTLIPFERLDRNGDGVLDELEAPIAVAPSFDRADTDGSGALSQAEYSAELARLARRLARGPALAGTSIDSWSAVGTAMDTIVRHHELDGAALLVGDAGGIRFAHYAGGYGPDTLINVASASKWPAGAAIAAAVAEGKLDPSAPLASWQPDLADPAKRTLTLLQLMSFTAGARSVQEGTPDLALDPRMPIAAAAAELLQEPLATEPGTEFAYGGWTQQVAAAWAVAATGEPLVALWNRTVRDAAGMHDSHLGHPRRPRDGHDLPNANLQAGLWTTPRDFARFLTMMAGNGVVQGRQVYPRAAIELIEQDLARGLPHRWQGQGAEAGLSYGFGLWCERIDPDGRCPAISSGGAWGTMPWLDRATGTWGLFFVYDRGPRLRADLTSIRAAVAALPLAAADTTPDTRANALPNAMPTPEPEDTEMYHRVETILEGWDSIHDHRTGTAGDRQTAEWLAGLARDAGLTAELQGFPFTRRNVLEAWVELDGERIAGLPLFDGGATGAAIEGPLQPLDSSGGIGVGRFSPAELDADTRAFAAALEAPRHQALVAISSGRAVLPGLAVINAEAYTEPRSVPVLQVATEHGPRLLEAAASGAPARLAISFATEQTEAFNVQARIEGRQPELAPLVVMTPRSSWWVSTAERGGGIVVWVEALRRLAAERPLRTVIFAANTGHELGHVGFDAWLATVPDLVGGAYAWVHLGANFAARDSGLRFQASDQRLLDAGLAALGVQGLVPADVTPIGTRPLGEARNVFDGGGRYVSLLGTNRWFHHPDDRLAESVDLARTVELTAAMLELIEELANAPG